ncbi:glycoside hydrolase family 15 protein [Plantactinospora sp. B6F1]|uniref:glycoside hydrolase family 15 protein n=1 Tax=Plantactinospora sp. B6F1 TaxID=3158971 RepID=UPI0032D8EEEC
MTSSFPPIDSYAFLSDTHTSALVGPDGAVEWFCVPRFDGDAVFARLLDRRAGVFSMTVTGADVPERRYLPDTLVLESRYRTASGTGVGHDFLAVRVGPAERPIHADHLLVRRMTALRGTIRLAVRIAVRPEYGRRAPGWELIDEEWWTRQPRLRLRASLPFQLRAADLCGEVELAEGQSVDVMLRYGHASQEYGPAEPGDGPDLLAETCRVWRNWSGRSDYTGVGTADVRHSALVLRGLCFDETGALVAAATAALPEEIGGVRNWDYRYTWHRDAALLLLALFRLGHADEGRRYLRFLLDVCTNSADRLAPLVGIAGHTEKERILPHLSGYADSAPVRIGNEAADQVQFDTYGHVLDAALVYQELTGELTEREWAVLRRQVDTTAARWREPDHGTWEIRGPCRHYVNSKVMSWVCLDRGIQLAGMLDDDTAPVHRWRRARDELRAEILDRGYDARIGSFVLAYGSTELDASLLRIPLVGFLPGSDPRVVGTIDRVREGLGIRPALLRRYTIDDGLPGQEGAFLLCCFEMVSALVLAGRVDEARDAFAELCRHAGPLGLYAEQLAADGTALGNYPQAFTHLALIEAALNLDAADDREALRAWAKRSCRTSGRQQSVPELRDPRDGG